MDAPSTAEVEVSSSVSGGVSNEERDLMPATHHDSKCHTSRSNAEDERESHELAGHFAATC